MLERSKLVVMPLLLQVPMKVAKSTTAASPADAIA